MLITITAIGEVIPVAWSTNPLIAPLAIVLIEGLSSSILLSQFVAPVMYKLLPLKFSPMNQHYSMLKKVVEVFHSYGIDLTGPRKNAHLILQLDMHPVFINGLIFELEYQLQVIIQEEKLRHASTPREIIALLMEIPQDN